MTARTPTARALGGRVIHHGTTSAEMEAKAREAASGGYAFVHPFDQPEVIAGQVLASGANLEPRLLQHALAGRTASSWKKTTNG